MKSLKIETYRPTYYLLYCEGGVFIVIPIFSIIQLNNTNTYFDSSKKQNFTQNRLNKLTECSPQSDNLSSSVPYLHNIGGH